MHLTRNIFAALDVRSHPADDQRREVDIIIVITRPLVSLPPAKIGVLTPSVNQSAREVWSMRGKFFPPSEYLWAALKSFSLRKSRVGSKN